MYEVQKKNFESASYYVILTGLYPNSGYLLQRTFCYNINIAAKTIQRVGEVVQKNQIFLKLMPKYLYLILKGDCNTTYRHVSSNETFSFFSINVDSITVITRSSRMKCLLLQVKFDYLRSRLLKDSMVCKWKYPQKE